MPRDWVLCLGAFGVLVSYLVGLGALAVGVAIAAAAAAALAGTASATPALRPVRVRARRDR